MTPHRTAAIGRVAALDEPTRRLLYDHVCRSARPVGRDEAAATLGLSRATVAFHLDRLAEEGLLDVLWERLSGRSGPGAGRPAKLYFRPDLDVEISLPPRRYELAGDLLATAVEESTASGKPVAETLARVARRAGAALATSTAAASGATSTAAASAATSTAAASAATSTAAAVDPHDPIPILEREGFEPRREGTEVVLGNCPFHRLATRHTELVCGMNRDLMGGLLDGLNASAWRAELRPHPGRCCVVLVPE